MHLDPQRSAEQAQNAERAFDEAMRSGAQVSART
jgi:hypothetical protein